MTIIADKDCETVRDVLARELVDDVELLFFTRRQQDCLTCDETGELLGQLADLSDHLHLMTHDLTADPDAGTRYNVTEVPAVLLRRAESASPNEISVDGTVPNVRFFGQPAGYEFSTLVADVVDVSKGETSLSPATVEALRSIETPVHIQVFVTPT